MRAVTFSVAFAVSVTLVVSSSPLDICDKSGTAIHSLLTCIRLKTSPEFRRLLTKLAAKKQCHSDICLVRAWCRNVGSFEKAAFRYMEYKYFLELSSAAKTCQARRTSALKDARNSRFWNIMVRLIGAAVA
ncbi:uncharacterized protein LOC144163064 [Haemaphysalis longicornis]